LSLEIVMPALEMAQEVGKLVRWLKAEGAAVNKSDPLMEIETDKATVEIEAPAAGILARITAQAGDEVKVGTVIAHLLTEQEYRDAGNHHSRGDDRPSAPPAVSALPPESAPGSRAQGTGSKTSGPLSAGLKSSPKVRRLAAEHGIDLSAVVGSGPEGTVTSADLARILGAGAGPAQGAAEYTVVPITGKRKIIASRLQQSYREAPHIALSTSVDLGEVLSSIEKWNTAGNGHPDSPLRITPVLLKALASTLPQFPKLNAHLVGEEIRQYRAVHLGVAVDLENGLIVPVLRDADQKSLGTIQSELEDIVVRARAGRLRLDELKGSTFTVSNLGMFGIEQFSAVLNPPEVAILSVGAWKEIPVGSDGKVVLRPMMTVTINVDHRALDGADAARFLKALKQTLQSFDISTDAQLTSNR
jgi:pyruvate dehydrogenase E2 component (dihydrolipoyllysine-residue acetyltransferase)